MKLYHPIKMIARLLILIGLLITLCSCAENNQSLSSPQTSASVYLQLADQHPQQQDDFYLKAGQRLILNRRFQEASQILQQITPNQLTPQQNILYKIARIKISLANKQLNETLQQLNQLTNQATTQQPFTPQQQILVDNLYAKAFFLNNNILAALSYQQKSIQLQQNPQRHASLNKLWLKLLNTPITQLEHASQIATDPSNKAWLQLALLALSSHDNTQNFLSGLYQWHQQYPQHIANELLPQDWHFNVAQSSKLFHIAVLLPETGNFSKNSSAIKQGILSAYYYNSTKNTPHTTLSFYDTSQSTPIQTIYKKAIANGANIVIGPLTKNNVTILNRSSIISVPTIALNSIITSKKNTLLYQFGLAPTDELNQIVNKLISDQHYSGLVLAPNNNWGKTIATAFYQDWQNANGHTADIILINPHQNLKYQIESALHVNYSIQRTRDLEKLFGKKLRTVFQRRQDIDFILLISNTSLARQIQPLMKYFYAGDLPIYSPSSIYSGSNNPNIDHDLNGIIFCDMPWVLKNNSSLTPDLQHLKTSISQTWKYDYANQSKLYALGIDAFDIAQNIQSINLLRYIGTPGATGTIKLSDDNHLKRELLWAQIKKGKASLTG